MLPLPLELLTHINNLPLRERQVLDELHGLSTGKPLTYYQICRKYRVSQLRIKMIEKRAVKRLRQLAESPDA